MRLATFRVQVALPEDSEDDGIQQAIQVRQETVRWFGAEVVVFHGQRLAKIRPAGPCMVCGKSMWAKRVDAKYCSVGCRQSSWRKKQSPTEPEDNGERPMRVSGGIA